MIKGRRFLKRRLPWRGSVKINMKIYLMTDLEGVAGVMDFLNWCAPEARYYETAKEFLTLETNAAIEGFFDGGASSIVVADGHGPGAVNVKLLDSRVQLMRGWPPGPWPLGLDSSFDAIAWVGQHAKSGTTRSHLTHTQDFIYQDLSINGISIGEFGQLAMCASELGVRAIFAAGEQALASEAKKLVPGIETVAVKRGLNTESGKSLARKSYMDFNTAAVHLQPVKAREMIKAGAKRAVERAKREKFGFISLKPPFRRMTVLRPDELNQKRIEHSVHSKSVIALMNMPENYSVTR